MDADEALLGLLYSCAACGLFFSALAEWAM